MVCTALGWWRYKSMGIFFLIEYDSIIIYDTYSSAGTHHNLVGTLTLWLGWVYNWMVIYSIGCFKDLHVHSSSSYSYSSTTVSQSYFLLSTDESTISYAGSFHTLWNCMFYLSILDIRISLC